ncbi:unnamed protein product [Schistosoma turkestanicum]|nr:unnamed protein product [Schistosoma turkestanicum]
MKFYYILLMILYLFVLSNGHMDEDVYQSEYALYPPYPYMSDDQMAEMLDNKVKHSMLENKGKWYANDPDNRVFYVHRRRFTRPYGR